MNRLKTLSLRLSAIACALLLLATVVACDKDDDADMSNWEDRNQMYYHDAYNAAMACILSNDTTWSLLFKNNGETQPTNVVLVCTVKKGKGTDTPQPTDSVKVHIKGQLVPSTSHPDGYTFLTSYNETSAAAAHPLTFSADGKMANTTTPSVEGLGMVLQKMHVGDHCRVYLPYELGYGTAGCPSMGIPPYSTLTYDITLIEIIK